MYDFSIVRPKSLAEAIAALAEDDTMALAGGHTLIPTLKQRLAAPATLVALAGVGELKGVSRDGDTIVVGGGATHAEVEAGATAYPALAALAGQIGDPAVRNRGTIGGSLANNDPAACYPAAVLASDATVVTNTRKIAAADFFDGMFTTALEPGEIITKVIFPIPQKAAYLKFAQPASRFALVGVFVAKFASGVRVAVTGASEEGVYRWSEAEAALDKDFSKAALASLASKADGLIGDIHATPEFRAHLIKVLTGRVVEAA
jgi:carbon-monoxide dehydrogenase medium subunit